MTDRGIVVAGVDFGIVRLTTTKDNSKLTGTKLDSPETLPRCASQDCARIVFDCQINDAPSRLWNMFYSQRNRWPE